MPVFLYVLALAVFAQGTSEFMLSGLVPGIAQDLSVSVGAAASLTSAYAIGMIVGAPVMAALSARWPRRRALAGFLTAFVVVHVIGAVTTDFAVLFGTRIVAAIVNAGFLAVAMSVATALVPAAQHARATAVLLSGVTLSCVAGVPAGALLGEWSGWRSAFWAVAALCLPALALVFRQAPTDAAGRKEVSIRREARVVASRPVQWAMVLAAVVNGATFATFAYLAVIATDIAHLPDAAVPALLAAFGVGAFVGVTTAGRRADGGFGKGLLLAVCALPLGWAVLAATSPYPAPLFIVTVLQGGLSFGIGSTLVTRVMRTASRAPSLGGSFATVALNAGAFLGPLVAGVVTETTGDYRGAVWVSAALAATAVGAVAASREWGARVGAEEAG
ncbi:MULTISPECIES: Cmx/CmrA family chloramphenicol efflux MFS transporter [Streptomyces violaceusniger group]|uniref:Cmx/CmrA family chloramphenicol efflux MFS transporter n=2 Tax=Streptomyces violaceusniger group TaxID=2839105 RepID=A0ABD5JMV2_9ACTN|nr:MULTISPECIES: Cmx/CmrA family chloramphenicol efflux MFS transporter [Streptomyces]KUL49799.1 chemotaxis protein [Streptomyces violaceusniger]MEE4589390.1 Cmx/CmrA family chloramphenicol efflux MFS transporter [Streptomyces sp. DSM 41602]